MGIGVLIFEAFALSMDAFAVSTCKGLATKKAGLRQMLICGAWFGGFQALMPLIGYFFGSLFYEAIQAVDHWVAFVLLALIGANMLREAFSKGEEDTPNGDYSFKTMLVMAIATSIDALAVGISMAMQPDVNIWVAIALIGGITFCTSALGVKLGNIFGNRFEKKAEIAGGVILILVGLKILLEGLGVL